jgi:diguanylate cyclase (GGDEF)-like protein/PAS domain S-box-containing protein
LLWLYVIADALIFMSYFAIPVMLAYFVWRKKNVQYGWVFMLFGAFILACGTTHLLGIVVLWNPIYWIDASMKGVTAIISVITAIAMIRLIPKALSLPTHAQLNQEVQARQQAYEALTVLQAALVESNESLEMRVNERTQELHEKEEYLRVAATAFESQEGMMVTDAKVVILRVNEAFTKITGYSAEEAIGQTPSILHSGKHGKEFYADMWESINKTGAWAGEIWNRRKSGEIYPEHLSITAVKDNTGIVKNYVASRVDITARKQAEERINNLSFYDPLTQLPNRRFLLDRLHQALATSERRGRRGALLFLDLDYFKTLNDTLGHDVGDLLLQQVAGRLSSCVRKGDTVARFGSDDFVVLLEDLSESAIEAASQTQDVAHKILSTLSQPYQLNEHSHHSTISIGASLFHGNEEAVEELLKQADIAIYQSKTEGRNTFRFFDLKMQEAIANRAVMEHELRMAIEHKQFQLYYQVQVGSSGRALGAEVLIRWIHPERGIISPFNFIPLAEETGLILPIGQWVLDAACAQLKTWQKNPLTRDLIIAVNVSAKQFFQMDFVEQVLVSVARHDINPTHLKLELTESMLVDNIIDIIGKMTTLSKIGIRFSLDDFGTGYSSLQYLKKLPLNQLKIDQSFVRDIVTDASDRAIVRTIVTMAHSLDINVIAEGVETEEQRQYLFDNGCTHYQGYLFSKPVPIDEFEALLSKN